MLFGTQSQPIDVGNTCVRDYVDSEDRISELVKIKDAVALFQRTKRCRHQPTIDDIGKGKKKRFRDRTPSVLFFLFVSNEKRNGADRRETGERGVVFSECSFFFLSLSSFSSWKCPRFDSRFDSFFRFWNSTLLELRV